MFAWTGRWLWFHRHLPGCDIKSTTRNLDWCDLSRWLDPRKHLTKQSIERISSWAFLGQSSTLGAGDFKVASHRCGDRGRCRVWLWKLWGDDGIDVLDFSEMQDLSGLLRFHTQVQRCGALVQGDADLVGLFSENWTVWEVRSKLREIYDFICDTVKVN